jgi:very-short-patch-repair endonuclease
VASGRWRQEHAGVFAVSPAPLTRMGRWKAAELACGANAALCHRSSAALRGLRPDNRPLTDIETVDGIRCTSLARTLLDLAEVLDRRGLERAIDQAEILQVLDMTAIDDVLARADGRRGAPILGEHYAGSTMTRNDIEELFLQICRHAHLPQPEVNIWIPIPGEEWQVDFLWRQQRLIVETDGRETHGTRQAFERDRARDQRLMLEGWRVIRFTWRQILNEPHYVADTLRRLLSASARASA